MGILDWFKSKDARPSGPDPLHDLTLEKMRPGYLVDYEMKTWRVTAVHHYEWGDDDQTLEWQLQSDTETRYLELEGDDEPEWSLSRKIPFGALDSGLGDYIRRNENPPDQLAYDGVTYFLSETAAGHFFKNRQGEGEPLLRWGYEDSSGDRYLGIEQWGDEDFEASLGGPVQEYQFANILPGR
jgi:hypothetical protein